MSFDLKIVNGDLSIKNGQLQTVIDSEKLIQDILKICLTNIGSNPISPWFGSALGRSIIGSGMESSVLVQVAKNQIGAALDNLKSLQDLQLKSLQRVSADEQLAAIKSINVARNQIDPRLFNIEIGVISKGLKPISTAFRLNTI